MKTVLFILVPFLFIACSNKDSSSDKNQNKQEETAKDEMLKKDSNILHFVSAQNDSLSIFNISEDELSFEVRLSEVQLKVSNKAILNKADFDGESIQLESDELVFVDEYHFLDDNLKIRIRLDNEEHKYAELNVRLKNQNKKILFERY
ncbi:MAG: hypothetical protein ACEQR5_03460 [Moraxellaceae bacterium]